MSNVSKDGYTFDGWYNGEIKVDKIEKGTYGDLSLKAKWTPIVYTATFMADNDIIGTSTYTVEDSKIKNIPVVPDRYGYDGKWEDYSIVSNDITINAVYTPKQYTIIWKNSDGSILKTTKCEFNKKPSYGNDVPTKKSDSQFDYTFDGWSPEIIAATIDTTYEAVYTKTQSASYKVTYNANGGNNAPQMQIKSRGLSIYLSSTIPSYGNYMFAGWYCANDELVYEPGSSFNIDANVTLYALWGEKCSECNGIGTEDTRQTCANCNGNGKITSTQSCPKCYGNKKICSNCGNASQTILNGIGAVCSNCLSTSFKTCPYCNGNGRLTSTNSCSVCGGDGISGSIHNCPNCNGKKCFVIEHSKYNIHLYVDNRLVNTQVVESSLPYKLLVPTKIGYTFVGWFDSEEGGIQYTDENGISLSPFTLNQDTFLCAKWSLNKYKVTYDCDEHVDLTGMPLFYTIEDNNLALKNQSRDYYTFEWKLENEVISCINTSMVKDILIEGVWTPIDYSITYDYSGGNGTNKTKYNAESNTFKLNNPIKEGYTFIGWTGSNGDVLQKEVTIEKGSGGNLSYLANWQINEYTISFNSNGGNYIEPITQEYNSKIMAKPSLYEKTFDGWYDESLTIKYETVPASNITLYAKWIDYKVMITFDEILDISVFDELNANLFNATAVDTDGNSVDISLQIIGGSKTVGGTVSIRFVAVGLYDVYSTTNLANIKVYGTPILSFNKDIEYINLSDSFDSAIFDVTAKDTFNGDLNVVIYPKTNDYNAGDSVTICFKATDKTGNEIIEEKTNVKVYGNPTINRNESIKDIKKSDTISNSLFGITAVDSFGEEVEVVTSIYSGDFVGGNVIQLRSVATDSKGNTSSITFDANVYDLPYIFNPVKTDFSINEEINLSTLGIISKDSFGKVIQNVELELIEGTFDAGCTLKYLVTSVDHLGNTNTLTLSNIKVYGNPTITYDLSKTSIRATDVINANLFSAIGKDSFNNNLDVVVSLNSGTLQGGNLVTFKLKTIDLVGNEYEVITQEIKVYSSEDITISYNVSSLNIKLTSKGEEFNASATNSFGESCDVYLEAAPNFSIEAGQTIDLYIVAEDVLGNTKKSNLISNVKIYGMPTLTYLRENNYIQNGDSPYVLFSVVDSFGNNLLFDVEVVSGSLEVNDTITYRITSMDRAKNELLEDYLLIVLDNDESIIDLYLDNNFIGSRRIYKGSNYSLYSNNGYDIEWSIEKNNKTILLTDKKGNCLSEWSLESDCYVATASSILTQYSITYELNGGVNHNNNPEEFNIESENITLNEPTKKGYTFLGWSSIDFDGFKNVIEIPRGSTNNRKYTANWSINTYTIDYVLNGGLNNNNNQISFTYDDEIVLFEPVREYYHFLGWYLNDNLISTITKIDFDITLEARWECYFKISNNTIVEVCEYVKGFNLIEIPSCFDDFVIEIIGQESFSNCKFLKSITIPNSVTSIGDYAFSGCSSLTSITIPNSVTSIGNDAFYKCTSLASITIPNSVTSIGNDAFYNCPIKYATISAFIVSYIDKGKLKEVFITSGESIGRSAFYNCSSLTSITIPNSVTSIGDYAFSRCSSLTSITIPNSVTSIGKDAFSNCSSLQSITIPNRVSTIGEYAFYKCTSLASITIPDSVSSIGRSAFEGCQIEYATIPTIAAGSISNSKLKEVVITSGEIMNSAVFSGCSSLESITLPFVGNKSHSSNDKWQYPFGYIFGTDSYTGGEATTQYYYGSSLTSDECTVYYIPSSLKNVTITGSIYIPQGAFYGCSSLTSITIPDSVRSIGKYAFVACRSLTSITIPNRVSTIGEYAFSECSSLQSITIPDGVALIGEGAFRYCSSLQSITIPDSVTTIGKRTFEYCSSLTIYCKASSIPSGWSSAWNPSDRPVIWGHKEE